MKVAINGFGRIGRSVFRILDRRDDVEVVAINDVFDDAALMYLLRYDTVMGPFRGPLALEDGCLVTAHGRTRMLSEKDPTKLPWGELGVDVVIEATGKFKTREQLTTHLAAGAARVVLTVPAKDEIDYTVVLGVNDAGLKPEHRIVSNAARRTASRRWRRCCTRASASSRALSTRCTPTPTTSASPTCRTATGGAAARPPRTSSPRPPARRAPSARCCPS